MEVGYVEAKSDNLPKVDSSMVAEFFTENSNFISAEIRGVKAERALYCRAPTTRNNTVFISGRHLSRTQNEEFEIKTNRKKVTVYINKRTVNSYGTAGERESSRPT